MNVYIIECEPKRLIPPAAYFRKKCENYIMELEAKHNRHFWGLLTACMSIARENYACKKDRRSNITSVVLTIEEADELFEIFKTYANVWTYQITS